MEQYIPKSVLVTEIEKRYNEFCEKYDESCKFGAIPSVSASASATALHSLLSFIDTLEVKEVDLEKEIDNIWNPRFNLGWDEKSLLSMNHEGFTTITKHFFELGLKAKDK